MKPVELIIANSVCELAAHIDSFTPDQATAFAEPKQRSEFMDAAARDMLCKVAHDASLHMVLKALAAVGAPASHLELEQRLTAARETLKREAARP